MTTVIDPALELLEDQKFKLSDIGFSEQKLRVLFLGRLIVAKGVYELIDGFEQALKMVPEIELIIARPGIRVT